MAHNQQTSVEAQENLQHDTTTTHIDDWDKNKTHRLAIERKEHGRVCYVDPNESFPQATYYLSDHSQRPSYQVELDAEHSFSSRDKTVEIEPGETAYLILQETGRLTELREEKNVEFVSLQDREAAGNTKMGVSRPQDLKTVVDKECGKQKQVLYKKKKKKQEDLFVYRSYCDFHNKEDLWVSPTSTQKFGTWNGVFVNVLLSVFGVIMFLRLAFVVGEAGLPYFIVILFLSTLATSLTCLSLSAICSNGLQRGGGAYYMTSRTIGPHVGSAIGLLLSVGMSVAISSYVIGFAETMQSSIGLVTDSAINDIRLYGVILSLFLLVWTLLGVSWVIKLQYWLVIILTLAISSFLIGCFLDHSDEKGQLLGLKGWKTGNFKANLKPHYNTDGGIRYDFWQALSLFFRYVLFCLFTYLLCIQAYTRIHNKKKKIHLLNTKICNTKITGTLTAIFTTSLVYLIMGIAAAGAISPEGLLHNYLCMVDIAAVPVLVYMGIYAATLSSALSVQLCAPRVLMSVANDNVLPILKVFGKTNKKGDPVASAVMCCGISLICVLIGDLNIVAPLITQ
ncbi:hypothetical protein RFI_06825, partial [Reticulomyxa filosa]